MKRKVFILIPFLCLFIFLLKGRKMEEIQKYIIRESLYCGEIDLSRASSRDVALYKTIIKDHMLSQKITEEKRDINIVKSVIVGSLALIYIYFFCRDIFYPCMIKDFGFLKIIYVSIYFCACMSQEKISDADFYRYIANFYVGFFSLVLLLKGAKSVLNYLNKLWYAKEYAHSDLLRDEAVLARLEKAEQRN